MKLSSSTIAQLAVVFLMPQLTSAADCTAWDQVFPWGQPAVEMMWSLRSFGCTNNWWKDIRIVPNGNACFSGGAPCWNGWFYYRGHPSQQACWDTTEQIITQCMWSKFTGPNEIHSTNGGTWSYGNEYVEGWFYNANSRKRDVGDLPAFAGTANNTVYLDMDEDGKVIGVAHDFELQSDGSLVDVAVKM